MSRYVVVVFPNEKTVVKGVNGLKDLDLRNSLALYGYAVIKKDSSGSYRIMEDSDQGPLGTTIGMLTGGLIGLLAGPAGAAAGAAAGVAATGAAVGMAGGAVLGSLYDLTNVGVGLDFVELVGRKMEDNTVSVVAEVEEFGMAPLDTAMEELGGTVFRKNRYDFEDEQFNQEIRVMKQELKDLKEEIKESTGETKAKLEAKADDVKKRLHEAHEKNLKKIDQVEAEYKEKKAKLDKQVKIAKDEAKQKIEKRIAEVKDHHHQRIAKLKEAGELIKEAMTI